MLRLTRDEVRSVDRQSIDDHHIPSIVLMENAARSFVDAIGDTLPVAGTIAILCGSGNNGGDGFAIARHLHNRGHSVRIVLAVPPEKLKGDALANWRIIESMGLDVCPAEHASADGVVILRGAALVIDALFGTGLSRPIDEAFHPLIEACNEGDRSRPVIAVDVPSGLDCDTGEPLGVCVRATRTITFAAEKAGFSNPRSAAFTGNVLVGDIGCPRELIEKIARAAGNVERGLS